MIEKTASKKGLEKPKNGIGLEKMEKVNSSIVAFNWLMTGTESISRCQQGIYRICCWTWRRLWSIYTVISWSINGTLYISLTNISGMQTSDPEKMMIKNYSTIFFENISLVWLMFLVRFIFQHQMNPWSRIILAPTNMKSNFPYPPA